MKKLLIIGFLLLVSACATSHRPSHTFNGVMVVNNSRELLNEVKITVPSNNRSFSCENVAPLGICSNRFGRRRYEHDSIQVEWTYGNAARQSDEFVIKVPATFSTGHPMRAVFTVSPQGEMSAYFDQKLPNK